jgi:multiple sugar transport system ATP-binding protein
MAEIRLENLQKRFGDFTAVREASFTVGDGDFFVLLGPSGCGKTTTLRMIAGLELPSFGRVLLDGEDVTFNRASHRDIGFVFQFFALYPRMNVRENIGFPLKCQGVPRAEIKQRVDEVGKLLRIEHLLERSVSGLSGGDSQRVALGRAIVRRAKAFMMDEPLGALDSEFRHLMCVELRTLHERIHATTVYVTHDQNEAMAMADTIAVMNGGAVEQLGPPMEVYERPASVFVADFIGSPAMNFLPFEAALARGTEAIRIGGATVAVPTLHEDVSGRPLLCGVRPEHVHFADDAALRAEVLGAEYLGNCQIVTLITAVGTTLRAKVDVNAPAARGDHVGLRFDAAAVSLFDHASGRSLRTARDNVVLASCAGASHG